jgi:hypothetical protein
MLDDFNGLTQALNASSAAIIVFIEASLRRNSQLLGASSTKIGAIIVVLDGIA